MSRFVHPDFSKDIYNNVISPTFPNLISSHKDLLLKYLTRLIDIVVYSFFPNYIFNNNIQILTNNKLMIINQLKENNYRDVIGLMYMLLPYIDETADKTKLETFEQLYILKNGKYNLKYDEPNYTFTNMQYNLINPQTFEEKVWNENDMKTTFLSIADTVRQMSYKLCSNWVNIIPKTFNINYLDTIEKEIRYQVFINKNKQSEWYEDINFYDIKSFDPELSNNDDTYMKLQMAKIQTEEIYNIISNDFFHNIKKLKWLIYDIKITDANLVLPLLVVLNHMMNSQMNICLNYRWTDLTSEQKELFKESWNIFLSTNKSTFVPDSSLNIIRKSIAIFFSNYYSEKQKAEKSGFILYNNNDEYDDYEENEVEDVRKSENKTLYSIRIEHLYDYFRETLQVFRYTIFGHRLINYDDNSEFKIINFNIYNYSKYYILKVNNNQFISCKTLYNYAKSLIHYSTKEKYHQLPKYACTLDEFAKQLFIDRLKDSQGKSWFNIQNNLRRLYPDYEKSKLIELQELTCQNIQKNLLKLVFAQLGISGTYTDFVINKNITDDKVFEGLSDDLKREKKRENYKKNNNIFGSYPKFNDDIHSSINFLTGVSYNKMKMMDGKLYPLNNIDGRLWYNEGYAFNWISQINFFNKYRNMRIIYVTGAPGVGKTSLIPLLFLYATKAVDHNLSGKLALTAPRRLLTQTNADTLATQMGVPIGTKSKPSTNFYIQYKHQMAKHESNEKHPVLKVMTDGSLWITLFKNIMMKTSRVENSENILTKHNIFDVIMIDEAHEHNTNMDMILTLAKYSAYFNNSIKLVIISATMENDEPIYRRSYRCIDDNLMYPYNYFYNNSNIDRNYLDRRLHVSIPGQKGGRYNIIDKYLPEIVSQSDRDAFVAKIANETTNGSLLYFHPKTKDILNSSLNLVRKVPNNMLVLPFYADLDENKKNMITKNETYLDNLKKIKIGVKTLFDSESVPDPINPPANKIERNNGYERGLLVATNIVEASLTINHLKVVFDTGTQITVIYEPKYGVSLVVLEPISESSRAQRRGRVGRVSDGIVYYFYPKDKTKNIKTSYKISIENITDSIYGLLTKNNFVPKFFDYKNNLYNINYDVLLNEKYQVSEMLNYQYFYYSISDNKYINIFDHVIENDHIKYLMPKHTIYTSGFDLNTLIDSDGSFYIIHPDEKYVKRNIIGQFTGTLSKTINYSNNNIYSEKMMSFIDNLTNSMYIVKNNDISNSNIIYYKTEFGESINNIKEEFMTNSPLIIDDKLIRCLIFSMALGVEKEILKFIAFSQLYSNIKFYGSFLQIDKTSEYSKLFINEFSQLYPKKTSDILTTIEFLQKLHNFLFYINLDIDLDKDIFKKELSLFYSDKYSFLLKYKNLFLQNGINPEIDFLKKNLDEIYINYVRKSNILISIIENNLQSNYHKINTWCDNNFIKFDVIIKYISNYLILSNKIYFIKNKIEKDNEFSNQIDIFKTINIAKKLFDNVSLHSMNTSYKLTLSLLFGYYNNIYRKIDNTPFYLSLKYPDISFTPFVSTIGQSKTSLLDSHTDPRYLTKYILALSVHPDSHALTVITEIKSSMFKYLGFIYNQNYIDNKLSYLINQKIDISGLENIKDKIISSYKNTLEQIKTDITENMDKDYAKYYMKILVEQSPELLHYGGSTDNQNIINIYSDTFNDTGKISIKLIKYFL